MKIKIRKEYPDIKTPTRGTKGAAGYDVYAISDYRLWPREGPHLLPLGLALEIPEGYYVTLVPRSSLGLQGILLTNSPATIDSDFRGFIKIMLANVSKCEYTIRKGDRIGQLILHKYEIMEFEEVNELKVTDRADGSFGSTGL